MAALIHVIQAHVIDIPVWDSLQFKTAYSARKSKVVLKLGGGGSIWKGVFGGRSLNNGDLSFIDHCG